jgi:putative flippase GtrA
MTAHPHRFGHYAGSELIALGIDLVLLWALVQWAHFNYLLATVFAYWIALTVHHHAVRKQIFRGTIRDAAHTYAYFIAVGGVGFIVTFLFMTLSVYGTHIHYLFARFMAALGVIPLTYALNAWLTFIMPKHLPNERDSYCLVGEHPTKSNTF